MSKNKGRPKIMNKAVQLTIDIDKTMKNDIESYCMTNGKSMSQFMREAIAEKLKNKKENV